eukprot:5710144-Pyramimonas_sp.AAC.1
MSSRAPCGPMVQSPGHVGSIWGHLGALIMSCCALGARLAPAWKPWAMEAVAVASCALLKL